MVKSKRLYLSHSICSSEANPGCCPLGKDIFQPQGQMTLWLQGQIYIFQQMKPGTSVIPHFPVILTGKSIYVIILFIQCDLQVQKINFKVK